MVHPRRTNLLSRKMLKWIRRMSLLRLPHRPKDSLQLGVRALQHRDPRQLRLRVRPLQHVPLQHLPSSLHARAGALPEEKVGR